MFAASVLRYRPRPSMTKTKTNENGITARKKKYAVGSEYVVSNEEDGARNSNSPLAMLSSPASGSIHGGDCFALTSERQTGATTSEQEGGVG